MAKKKCTFIYIFHDCLRSKSMLLSGWFAHFPLNTASIFHINVFLYLLFLFPWNFCFPYEHIFYAIFTDSSRQPYASFPIFSDCICSFIIVFFICHRWFYIKTFVGPPWCDGSWRTLSFVVTGLTTRYALSKWTVCFFLSFAEGK